MALPEYPITNEEHYLAAIAGQRDASNLPEPVTRTEEYLKFIAENGSGGGSWFEPGGNIAFTDLPALSEDVLGIMYNVTDEFTSDNRFNDGGGVRYPAGTNVAVVNTGTDSNPVYKYDTFAGAYTVDSALSDVSENPVQNKVVKGALDGKETKAEKLTYAQYQALVAAGTVDPNEAYYVSDAPTNPYDDELNGTSENAPQTKVVNAAVNKVLSEIEIQAQINDRIYQGVDLTVKFAAEIAASPYNNDPWAWIKARIVAGNFTGIHVGDWIPFTTTNNYTFNAQIAGINTYTGYGNDEIRNHIDFISVELLNTRHPINNVNYNNGVATVGSPWLASDLYLYLNALAGTVPSAAEAGGGEGTAVDYTASGVYYYLPPELKAVIVNKRFTAVRRYSADGLLTDDNQWYWYDIGKLWLPDEFEIFGSTIWGTNIGYAKGGAVQYPLFAGTATNRVKKRGGTRYSWWTSTPTGSSSQRWCTVANNGRGYYSDASSDTVSAPICFRVA